MKDDRQQLEALWKQRWGEAKRRLELAAIHVRQIEHETRSGEVYRQALETEILAAAEYTRVLRTYTDLVVYEAKLQTRISRGIWLRAGSSFLGSSRSAAAKLRRCSCG